MGIRFECVHCGHTLHVKDFLAGKRGICPHCQGRIDIPATPGNAAQSADAGGIAVEVPFDEQATREMAEADRASLPAAAIAQSPQLEREVPIASPGTDDPIAEAPHLHWYVLPPGSMTKFGPAPGDMMRSWIGEGRVAADSLVWREGWPQWRVASTVFSQFTAAGRGDVEAVATQARQDAASAPAARAVRGAVILGVDDFAPQASSDNVSRRATKPKRARDRTNLIIGLLATLVLVLLPLLIYVLMQ
jgi:hypothetical protein